MEYLIIVLTRPVYKFLTIYSSRYSKFFKGIPRILLALEKQYLIRIFHFILSTFVKADGSERNILDYIKAESLDRISHIISKSPLGDVNQGHISMEWDYKLREFKHQINQDNVLKFRKYNFEKMNKEFAEVNWDLIFENIEFDQI